MTSPQTLTGVRLPARDIQSVLQNRWARFLIPSLSDLFFLAILGWIFMSSGPAGWQGLLEDGDVGWHIRTGQWILNHHAVPHHDLYSFSKPDAPWFAWEWLTDVMDGALERVGGLKAIVLMAGVVIAVFATTVIRRMVWRGSHLFIAMAAALLAIGSSTVHFLARPHIFTLLLLSISVWMVEADREKPSRRIWLLVPLTVVWTNLHGGFLALIALLGLAAAGLVIERKFGSAIRYAGLTAACAAASVVNPYGIQLHKHVGEYLKSDWIRNMIQEFQSPSFRNESMMQYEALLLVGVMVAGLLLKRGRVVEAMWIVFFAHMSLSSVRHVPVYVTVAAPILAFELSDLWRKWTADAKKSSLAGIINGMAGDAMRHFRRTSAWPVAVVLALIMIGHPIPWPTDFGPQLFPVAMVHAHPDVILNKRVLTTDQWSDYLIYVNPQQKVFIDGRSDFYGPEIGNDYIGMMNGRWDWDRILEKYRFDSALVPVDGALAQLLKTRGDWGIVQDDGKRILLVHRGASVPATGNPEP
jgi:hypothetical protein